MARSSSANSTRVHSAILVIFLIGRRCHLLSRVGDIIFVSGIRAYGRTGTIKSPVVTYYVPRAVEVIKFNGWPLGYVLPAIISI